MRGDIQGFENAIALAERLAIAEARYLGINREDQQYQYLLAENRTECLELLELLTSRGQALTFDPSYQAIMRKIRAKYANQRRLAAVA